MRLHVFSDLHFDARALSWEPSLAPGADVVVCAGDVCEGMPEAFAFLRSFFPRPTPIVTVAGNHSFYQREMREELARGRVAAADHGITFLENQAATISGVRFIGATLWTDYCLDRGEPGDEVLTQMVASRQMNDHALIALGPDRRRFTTTDAFTLHDETLVAFDSLFAEPFDGPTVVITHHAPHPGSIAPHFQGDPLNPAFASDLTWHIKSWAPDLWIHGHTHASCDYRVGRTRVLCNPHGYGRENVSGFDPALVIEV
ncbi:metallophosphoesterase [Methylobacterium sp. Leaf118]|uniref:metallophosphoesterase n=1 Tax=Methylobacterium sp. Leaf118 TaxID=2876562 RepID=UPI001E59ECF9|nr:metallophosphoesterase [Methylobacterium sp. Leaf118]